jgi:hypothetical protein
MRSGSNLPIIIGERAVFYATVYDKSDINILKLSGFFTYHQA